MRDWLCPTVLLLFVSVCLGCEDGPYVMHEEFVQSGDATRYLGGGCEQIAEGQTSATGTGGENLAPYAFELRGTRDGVEAVLSARDGKLRVERHYSEDFLRSGGRDELAIATSSDEQARVALWAGRSAEAPREIVEDASLGE